MIELQTEEPQKNKTHTWRLYWFHATDPDANYPADTETLARAGYVPAEHVRAWNRKAFVTWFDSLPADERVEVWYECEASTAADVRQQLTDTKRALAAAERVSTEQRERAKRTEAELEKEKSWCAKVLDGYRQLAEYFQECANNMTVHEATSRRLLEDARDMAQASLDEFSTQCPAPAESATVGEKCGNCARCLGTVLSAQRMVVCPTCGNKRCPKATYHKGAKVAEGEVVTLSRAEFDACIKRDIDAYNVVCAERDHYRDKKREAEQELAGALYEARYLKAQLRDLTAANADVVANMRQEQEAASEFMRENDGLREQLRDLTAKLEWAESVAYAARLLVNKSLDREGVCRLDDLCDADLGPIRSLLDGLGVRSRPSPTSKQDPTLPSGVPDAPAYSGAEKPREDAGVPLVAPDNPSGGVGATSATGEAKPAEPAQKPAEWQSDPTCPTCKGAGIEDGNTLRQCQTCGGRGVIQKPLCSEWVNDTGARVVCSLPLGHGGTHDSRRSGATLGKDHTPVSPPVPNSVAHHLQAAREATETNTRLDAVIRAVEALAKGPVDLRVDLIAALRSVANRSGIMNATSAGYWLVKLADGLAKDEKGGGDE